MQFYFRYKPVLSKKKAGKNFFWKLSNTFGVKDRCFPFHMHVSKCLHLRIGKFLVSAIHYTVLHALRTTCRFCRSIYIEMQTFFMNHEACLTYIYYSSTKLRIEYFIHAKLLRAMQERENLTIFFLQKVMID